MEIIYTNNIEERVLTPMLNSGLFFASDPSNYTANSSTFASWAISGYWSVTQDIQAFDELSDEIGIIHEIVEGEIAENNDDV
jgi:hypothetical protein